MWRVTSTRCANFLIFSFSIIFRSFFVLTLSFILSFLASCLASYLNPLIALHLSSCPATYYSLCLTLALCMPLSLAFPLALLFVLYLTLPCIWHFLQPTLLPPFFSSYRKEDSHGNYHFHGNLIRIFLEKECLKSF